MAVLCKGGHGGLELSAVCRDPDLLGRRAMAVCWQLDAGDQMNAAGLGGCGDGHGQMVSRLGWCGAPRARVAQARAGSCAAAEAEMCRDGEAPCVAEAGSALLMDLRLGAVRGGHVRQMADLGGKRLRRC